MTCLSQHCVTRDSHFSEQKVLKNIVWNNDTVQNRNNNVATVRKPVTPYLSVFYSVKIRMFVAWNFAR
jgi:hypothetical protein